MGLEEDIDKIYEDAQAARKVAETQLKAFADAWDKVRDNIVNKRFCVAANHLSARLDGKARFSRENGGTALYVGSKESRLAFAGNAGTRKIACDSSEQAIVETFDVENVTEEEVDRKIKEFIRAIA